MTEETARAVLGRVGGPVRVNPGLRQRRHQRGGVARAHLRRPMRGDGAHGARARRQAGVEAGGDPVHPGFLGVKREVGQPQDHHARGPVLEPVGVAGGGRVAVLHPARAGKLPGPAGLGRGHLGAGRAQEGCEEFEGAAQLACGRGGEGRVGHQRADDLRDLVGGRAVVEEDPRQPIYQRGVGVVGQKPTGELAADEARRRGMRGEKVKHLFAVLQGGLMGREFAPEDALLVGVVPGLDIGEAAGLRRGLAVGHPAPVAHRPAGEGAGHLPDVIVEVAFGKAFGRAGHVVPVAVAVVPVGPRAEGVEFEEFAGEVFIRGAGAALVVGEVDQHRGRGGDVAQKRAEAAEGMGAQAGVVGGEEDRDEFVLQRVDVEVVVPELGDQLAQLSRGVDGADQAGGDHFLPRAAAFGIGHGAVPVEQRQEAGRVGGEGREGAEFIDGGPAAVGVAVGVIGDAQAGGGEAGGEGGVFGRGGKLGVKPGGGALGGKIGAGLRRGAEGEAVEPEVGRDGGFGGGFGAGGPGQGRGRKGSQHRLHEVAAVQHPGPPCAGRRDLRKDQVTAWRAVRTAPVAPGRAGRRLAADAPAFRGRGGGLGGAT